MKRRMQGQVALITGGVRRIGRATALALAEEGAKIVINTRSSRPEAEAVASEVASLGSEAMVHLADVTDESEVSGMFAAIRERFGRLDVLVNNAANRRQSPLTEMSYKEWREITNVILDGAFLCARGALPIMIEGRGGTIVNIGGMTGHTGAAN